MKPCRTTTRPPKRLDMAFDEPHYEIENDYGPLEPRVFQPSNRRGLQRQIKDARNIM